MTYEDCVKEFPGFNGKLYLYITGSQGVAPNGMWVYFGKDFQSWKELETLFLEFIDENAFDNLADYLDDCDGDEDDAMGEAVCDSGEFLLGASEDNLTHEYDGFGNFSKRSDWQV